VKENQMAPRTLARRHARTGWAHPYRSPFVFYADGGDGEPAEPATPASPEPGPAAEPADDWTPPTREEFEELIKEKAKLTGEAASRRKWLKAAGYDPKTGQKLQPEEPEPAPAASDDAQPQGLSQAEMKKQVDRAVAEAKIEGMRGAKKLVGAFNKALADAGWNGQRLELIMPLVDFDEVDLDDPEDLAERIESVKKLFPEGFKRTRQLSTPANGGAGSGQNGAPAVKVDTADKKPPASEPKNWAQTLADRALRG
jgi:hypothetical protein